jgi:hypothetical protein
MVAALLSGICAHTTYIYVYPHITECCLTMLYRRSVCMHHYTPVQHDQSVLLCVLKSTLPVGASMQQTHSQLLWAPLLRTQGVEDGACTGAYWACAWYIFHPVRVQQWNKTSKAVCWWHTWQN